MAYEAIIPFIGSRGGKRKKFIGGIPTIEEAEELISRAERYYSNLDYSRTARIVTEADGYKEYFSGQLAPSVKEITMDINNNIKYSKQ